METKQKRVLTVIGVTVIAIIVSPVIFSVAGSIYSLSINRPLPIPKENPLTVSEDSKWMKHTDKQTGFSISYPPEMYLSEKPFKGYHATFLLTDLKEIMNMNFPSEIAPRIQVFKSDTPISEFLPQINENRNKDQFPEFAEIELNGYEAYQTKAFDPEVIFTHTIIGNENKTYLLELFTIEKENDALKEIYDRMLQSFEILENE